jgi:LysR family nitrogen assimilation transcriptional regulator
MNSDDLACFARVVACGSFSRAAVELGSDQSTISRQMARLEAEARTRLFHRSGRGVELTEPGRLLLAHAQRVAAALDDAQRTLQACADDGPAQIVIAAQPTIANTTFAAVGKALLRQFPRTRLRFVEGLGTHMVGWLASGEIDIAILYLPAHAGGLEVDLLLHEQLCLVGPPGDPSMTGEWPLHALADVPLILPGTPHGLRLLAESLASRLGITLNVALECDASTSVTKRLVQEGCGYTLLPLAAVSDELAAGRLTAVPLADPAPQRDVALATSRNRPPVAEQWDVTQIIRREVQAIVANGGWPGATSIAQK